MTSGVENVGHQMVKVQLLQLVCFFFTRLDRMKTMSGIIDRIISASFNVRFVVRGRVSAAPIPRRLAVQL